MRPTHNNKRSAHVVIDVAAYSHNLQRARDFAPNAKVMAIIKADGYGHGMTAAAYALSGANEFGVTDLHDARGLRDQGIDKPLTLLSAHFDAADLVYMANSGIRPVIYEAAQLTVIDQLPELAALDVWLKIDTGMGRLGFSVDDAHSVMPRLSDNPRIKSLGLMTHLANADAPDHPLNRRQLKLVSEFAETWPGIEVSVLNSAGSMAFAEHAYDMIRPGLMLYGISPLKNTSHIDFDLQPVMSFRSHLLSVKRMPAGSSIGYGSTYSLDSDSRIGVVAAGYGDGYPRHAPNGTPVLVNGMIVPLIGRVSMDLITVDLGDVSARVGDAVTLWGEGNPVETIAELAGTIGYELTCSITQRVERVLINNADT